MREQIAVLDGLSMVADGIPGYAGHEYGPVPSNGGNLIGGSNWFDGAPYRLQQEGLAGLSMDPVGGYAGKDYTPEPGEGALYVGGSNWFPGAPTRVSAEGLAGSLSVEPVPGYAGHSINPEPGGGALYEGGSSWSPGTPTRVSQQGLVGVPGAAPPPWRFPLYDERDKRILMLLACGAMRMFQAIYGIARPLEVRNCAETVMSRLRNSGPSFERIHAASAQDVAYLGALYVADRYATSWPPAFAKARARAASQTCGG